MRHLDGQNLLNVAGAVLAIVTIIELPVLTSILAFVEVPASNRDLLSNLLSAYAVQFAIVIGYFFGSNRNSKQQEETIHTLARQAPAPGSPAVVVQTGDQPTGSRSNEP